MTDISRGPSHVGTALLVGTAGVWTAIYAAVLCTAVLCAAVVFYPHLFLSNLRQFSQLVLAAGILSLAVLLIAALVHSPRAPLTWIKVRIGSRVSAIAGIALACTVGMAAFWTLKYQIPAVIAFWADPYFAAIDRALHFGDPWEWVHAITPKSAAQFLAFLYLPGWLAMFFAGIVTASVVRDDALRRRYFLTFMFVYVALGLIGATLFSSVGPIFYDSFFASETPRFRELLNLLRENPGNAIVLTVADRLYAAYNSMSASGPDNCFAGISAMPSIHVAVATLNAVLLSRLARWAGVLGWMFVVATMFCSVYFGWHYAIDGYVSIVTVVWFWRLSSRYAE